MEPRTQIEQAGRWIAGLTLDDVPGDVIRLAVAQRINILAAIYAGARTPTAQAITAAVDRLEDGGRVITLPDGRARSLPGAVFLQAVYGCALELDDFVFAGHTGQAAVGVSLALGQLCGTSGDEVLLAQIAANEVAGRMGAVMTAGPQHGHMKAYLNRAAAATVAAKLLGLNAHTTSRALAIALSMPEYTLFPAAFSPDTKALCIADPAVAGVRAAYLAAEGIDAALDVVENPVGLVTSLSAYQEAPPIWDRLGQTWSTQAICYKPLVSCAYACAASQAVSELIEAEGRAWDPQRIERVEVGTTALTMTLEGFSRPHREGLITPVNTNFSTRRTVALSLLVGRPRGDHFTADRFEELKKSIAKMTEKVHLHHNWRHTLHLLRGVDAAIDHPGRPGIYGMTQAHATMDKFKKSFGTPSAVSPGDIPRIAALGSEDFLYLLRRYLVGYRAKLPFRGGARARSQYVSRETDLRKMELRFASDVTIHLTDDRRLSREVLVPAGFAGDPERERIPRDKFLMEVASAKSRSFAENLLAVLERGRDASPTEIVDMATRTATAARKEACA